MERFVKSKLSQHHIWTSIVLSLIIIAVLAYFQWIFAVIFTVLLIVVVIFVKREERQIEQNIYQYMDNLAYEVDHAGKHVFLQIPMGIIIYDESFKIKWANPYMIKLNNGEKLYGSSLSIYGEDLIEEIENNTTVTWLKIEHLQFQTEIDAEARILYLFNRTEERELKQMYEDEKIVLAHIYLDNYEEISRNMSDNVKSHLNSRITSVLNQWADAYQFYLKRTSQDRFLGVFTQRTLDLLEKSNFEILDEMKKLDVEEVQRNPVTLSIGVGTGNENIPELAKLAQSSLDLALGRGGDQIAIRDDSGKVRFYGGKSNPMEKRTRVRARVISHALKELVKESDNVIIMGHKSPDMDALGSAIGVLKIAKSNNVEGYIVYDQNDILTGISRVMDHVKQQESLWKYFIGPEEAEAIYTSRSLIVVVDTHRPDMAAHEKLLRQASYKVVIDHHRRGEDFVDNPTLVYMEPYASSTAELVTELIEYQPNKKPLSTLEATALLSGIIVDTKSFALRTGSRTFDAASYLRAKGADPVLIQSFLKEDLGTVIQRNKLIERAYISYDSLAIAVADEEDTYDKITIAQAADSLLTIEDVSASFVFAKIKGDKIAVSARSLGEINVQIIMEEMDGGGHLTNAATQLSDITLKEAEELLQEKLKVYFEGRT